jgi:hypothetical protein
MEIESKVIEHYRNKYGRKTHILNMGISIFLGLIILSSSFYLISLQKTDSVEAGEEISKVLLSFGANSRKEIYKEEVNVTEKYINDDREKKSFTKTYSYIDNIKSNTSEYSYTTIDGTYSYTTKNVSSKEGTDQIITFGNEGNLQTVTYKGIGIKIDKRSEMLETIKLYRYLIDTNKIQNLKTNNSISSFDITYLSSKWTKDKVIHIELRTTFYIDKETYLPIKTVTTEVGNPENETETSYKFSFKGEKIGELLNMKNTDRLSGKVNIVWNTTKIPDVYIGDTLITGTLVYSENSDVKDFWKILNGKEISVAGIKNNNTFNVESISY